MGKQAMSEILNVQSSTAEASEKKPMKEKTASNSHKNKLADNALQITDAQIHMWKAGKPSAHQRQKPFPPELLLREMEQAGVASAVVVPPSWDPSGNEPANEMADRHPSKFRVMGRLELDRPNARAAIAEIPLTPNMLGFRVMFTTPERRAWLKDGKAEWLWRDAQQAKIPLMVHVPYNLHTLKGIAGRYPELRFVVDHLGVPPHHPGSNASMAHIPELLGLAELSNVAVKATGVAGYSSEPYPYKNLHDPLHRVFDAFGPSRMFWGSDLTRMNCSYSQCISLFTEELPWLSESDKRMVMGEGLRNWVGWR
jgi:predicted TIM-barrel fold metal-dependent hydrolase